MKTDRKETALENIDTQYLDEPRVLLSEMKEHTRCMILKVHGHGGFRHRIMELGFVRGEIVDVVKNAPLLDPVEYRIMGSHVSLRRSEAANIEVVSLEADAHPDNVFNGTIEEHVTHEVEERGKQITVALVGNPNCGKTSFFNFATGLREKVGNYSGVTVSSKTGTFHHQGYTINMVDLPGTYSLTEFTPEELYVREYLTDQKPDIVLNVVDAGNLERNLFLTTQLIDQNPLMLMALNMYDELQRSGATLDIQQLSAMLGFPIVPTVAKNGQGIDEVLGTIVELYEHQHQITKHIHINYGEDVERCIRQIRAPLDLHEATLAAYCNRYAALKLLEGDKSVATAIEELPNSEEIRQIAHQCRERLEHEYRNDISTIVSDLKYGFVRGALSETYQTGDDQKKQLGYALDVVLTNRWLGIPVLLLFLWIMFQATFTLGAYPQQWIEMGIEWLAGFVRQILPAGMLSDLLADGIISGVGGVLVFLPNILILFFFISLLEDTGYMARAAFIMDKFMHKIGLHGKSFIPYIIGLGCGVPAIMATRTLENPKDRMLTILTIPFISCSARLPVYILFVSAFFPKNQGLVLMSIYLIGVLVAIVTSLVINRVTFKKATDQFVMELPPYRFPTLRNILIHMWDKSVMYLKKMGTVILFASVIIWALGYFPHSKEPLTMQQQVEQSFIGSIGHGLEPVVRPLGFDWKMGVSLCTGLAAKEIIVSTMGVLYGADDGGDAVMLGQKLQSSVDEVGQPFFTPLKAYCFLLFILLYMPCFAAVAAVSKEAGRKWAVFSVVYTTLLAWVVTFVVWQVGNLLI